MTGELEFRVIIGRHRAVNQKLLKRNGSGVGRTQAADGVLGMRVNPRDHLIQRRQLTEEESSISLQMNQGELQSRTSQNLHKGFLIQILVDLLNALKLKNRILHNLDSKLGGLLSKRGS